MSKVTKIKSKNSALDSLKPAAKVREKALKKSLEFVVASINEISDNGGAFFPIPMDQTTPYFVEAVENLLTPEGYIIEKNCEIETRKIDNTVGKVKHLKISW